MLRFAGAGVASASGGKEAAGYYAGFAGATVLALWMGHPQRKTAWLAGALATVLASLSCGIVFHDVLNWEASVFSSGVTEFLAPALLPVCFQSLTAVGLGARLWWREGTSS